jgi:hypothetical protein
VRCEDVLTVPKYKEPSVQDAEIEDMPSTGIDIDWAIDFESLDFLRPSFS